MGAADGTNQMAAAAAPGRTLAERLLTIERDLGVALAGVSGLAPAVGVVLDAALLIEPFDCGGVYLIDARTGNLELQTSRGLSARFTRETARYGPDSKQVQMVRRGATVFLGYDELAETLSPEAQAQWLAQEGLRVIGLVPISYRGVLMGCVNVSSHTSTVVPDDARHALESVASRIGSTIARIRAEDALRASEERLRVLYDNALDGILLANAATKRFTEANHAICKMLGYTLEELRTLSVNEIHPPESLAYVVGHFERQAATGGYVAPDIPVLRKDGTVFFADVNSTAVELHGETFLLGVFRDVTERRRMQEEVQKAQRLESVGVLAGGIAHDFNNILTAIIGNISLARRQPNTGGATGDLLDAAERATLRARDLTQQLLTFARGGTPVRRPASLAELIRESTEFALRGSSVKAEFDLPDELWSADVDPGQVGRVIQNLVINAANAMPAGGQLEIVAANHEVGEIDAAPLRPGRYVRFSVLDHGCGIHPDDLPRIFEPYFTTRRTGSGLGLAVTYSVVAKHQGHIEVESTVGAGSTFHVYLPAASGQAESATAAAQSPWQGHGRVLVMDDDEEVLETAARMLAFLGYEVSTAREGGEAARMYGQAIANRAPFALVILDLTVPAGMGGIACAAELRKLDPDAKILVSSGYSDDPVMSAPHSYGICGVVAKPYRMDELREALAGG